MCNLVLLKAIKYTVFYYFHGNKCLTHSVRIAEGHTEHIIASIQNQPNGVSVQR